MAKASKKPAQKKKTVAAPKPLSWPLGEKQTFWVFAGMITLITLVLYSRYLFGSSLFIFTDMGSDTITLFYPNLVQAARYFQDSIIPGWSFYVGIGSNTYPGYLNAPLNIFYLPMNEVTIAHSIAWVQAGVMIGTGLVFYRFLREVGFTLPVRVIGGICYTFGGYLVIGSSWYTHSHSIFWMTCAFLGFELLLRKKSWWLFVIPFIALLGTRAYFLVLFMAVYSIVRTLDVYQFSVKELLLTYKRMIICGVIAVLLALPFLGGEWHRFKYSPRVSGDVSYSDELSKRSILHIANKEHFLTALFRTYSNDAIGTGDKFKGWKNYLEAPAFYMGLLTMLLVFQFFALATPRRRLLYGAFLGVWFLFVLFPWFRFAFYGFAGNYYKGALSLFIPFSFLLTGLMGFQEIISQRRVHLPVLIISFLVLITLLWIPYVEPEIKIDQSVLVKVSLFLVVHLALLIAIWAEAVKKWILLVLVFVVGIEAVVLSWPAFNERLAITKTDINQKKYHFDDSAEAMDYIRENEQDLFYRVDKMYGSVKSGFNDGMVQGYFGSKVYQSHNHKNFIRFIVDMGMIDGRQEANTRWVLGVAFNAVLHPLFTIKYVLANTSSLDKVDNSVYAKIHQVGDVSIYKNKWHLPFGIPFHKYYHTDDFMKMSFTPKSLSLYDGVVIDDPRMVENKGLTRIIPGATDRLRANAEVMLDKLPAEAMKMESFNQKNIKGSIELDSAAVVFFSIPFDDGWHARVDGVEKELWQVNLGLTGLYVEPGKHNIELSYIPPLSVLGWLGWLGVALIAFMIYRWRVWFWGNPSGSVHSANAIPLKG